jgi:hypothetical protein
VIRVEDWAQIRRLHRAEGLAIKEITRRLGGVAQHGALGAAGRGASDVCAFVAAVGGGRVRTGDPGAAGYVPADAGDRHRRAGSGGTGR